MAGFPLRIENYAGRTISAGEVRVTPHSQALIVNGKRGGVVWNRPLLINVERDGHLQTLPIHDVTRLIQIGLLTFTVLFLVAAFFIRRSNQQESE